VHNQAGTVVAGTWAWAASANAGTAYPKYVGSPESFTAVFTPAANADQYTNGTTLTDNIPVTVSAPLRLTIQAPTGTPTKVYDGNTTYTGTGITLGDLDNVVASDDVQVVIVSTTYNNANVAAANQITIVYGLTGAAAGNYIAPVNGTITATITKAPGAAVSGAPTADDKDHERITVNTVTNESGNEQTVEYAISEPGGSTPDDSTWQPGTTFGGLDADTTYYIFARTAESPNFNAGEAQFVQITTAPDM
jgi:hypothetical protein